MNALSWNENNVKPKNCLIVMHRAVTSTCIVCSRIGQPNSNELLIPPPANLSWCFPLQFFIGKESDFLDVVVNIIFSTRRFMFTSRLNLNTHVRQQCEELCDSEGGAHWRSRWCLEDVIIPHNLTIRASLAPRNIPFLAQGPEGPFCARHYNTIYTQGPKGPFRALEKASR